MRIAICDDERVCLDQVLSVANEFVKDRPEHHLSITTFSHPEDLLESAEKLGGYDIYILDVVMPHMNGIQLGVNLRNHGYDGKIIYLTTSEEFALDSFRVRAFDYLIKPIQNPVFYKVVDDALASIASIKDKCIVVKTKTVSAKLNYEQILYVELSKRVLRFQVKGGKVVESTHIRTTFSEAVAELAADTRFVYSGASTLVNLNRVAEINNEAVSFDDGTKLYLSQKNCRELRGLWISYLFEEESL